MSLSLVENLCAICVSEKPSCFNKNNRSGFNSKVLLDKNEIC